MNFSFWEKYHEYIVVKEDIDSELQFLFRCLFSFHQHNEDKKDLNVKEFSLIVFSNLPKNTEYLEMVLENLETLEVDHKLAVEYINAVHQNRVYQQISIAAYEVSEGKKSKETVDKLIESLYNLKPKEIAEDSDNEFVSTDLSTLVDKTYTVGGLYWRLACLNKSLGPLRQGDFGFIFSRPETGKTTFLASEITYMLSQLPEDKTVLWFNNEQVGEAVMLRLYQALFGLPLAPIIGDIGKYNQSFNEASKGRLKLVDSANITRDFVEKVCAKYSPGLIIFDQLDKIKGFDNDQEHLKLGAIYIWARELAKQYCPVIGVSQADATGENVKYLTMNNVAQAKTSKQAEADWILGIGCVHDPGWESVRFFNISKNKLLGDENTDPKLRHGQFQVLIDPVIARYKEIPNKQG